MRLACFLLAAIPGCGQLAYTQFEPQVIVPGSTQTVVLSTRVSMPVTSVVFQWTIVQAPQVILKDDGTGGDKVAGDEVYSATLPATTIVNATTPQMAFRPPIGFIVLMNGMTQLAKYGVNAEIAAPDIPRLPVTQDAPDVQHTAYLVNIRLASAFPAAGANPTVLPDYTPVIRRFYQIFPDQFEMVNVVYGTSFFQNRYHNATRNDVQGVGVQIFNSDAQYGSAGALLGINHFPLTSYFDGGETAFVHEFGHQWINFLKLPVLAAGTPHWPVSSFATGVMGFTLPEGAGGLFPCQVTQEAGGLRLTQTTEAPSFTDLDLYLMGLIPPEQVGQHYVFADQSNGGVLSQCTNKLYTGGFTMVSMSDILGNAGKRIPDSTASKKNYRLATIIVTRDALLDADAMAFYSYFARRGEETGRIPVQTGLLGGFAKPMAVATGGRLAVNLQVVATLLPSIFFGGVANGSSGNPGTYQTDTSTALAPGSFVSVYGTGLAAADAQAPSATLPQSLGGVTVQVNGKPVPLFFVSAGQINFQLPFETPAPSLATVVVKLEGQPSSIAWIRVIPAAPGITVFGQNRAAIRNQDTSVNLPANPASVGSVISIYLTGIGPVNPAVASGQPAPESPLARAAMAVTASIGGKDAHVEFAGLTPDSTGLAQVNVTVPSLPPGDYPVWVTVGNVASNKPLVSVQ